MPKKTPLKFSQLDLKIPRGKRVEISENLLDELRERVETDRSNRFQLYLLCAGIRNKYLDKKTRTYSDQFLTWYKKNGLDKVLGSIPNFTKFASAGDVINWISQLDLYKKEEVLSNIPLSTGALYEMSMVLKMDKEIFRTCLLYTPTRKSVDEPKIEWKTKKQALFGKSATELSIRLWRRNWENPPPPKQKRTDKRTLKTVTITCNGELLDFDRKTGDKVGILDLDEVEDFFEKLNKFLEKEKVNPDQFKVESHLDYLTNAYYKRKEFYDPARNVLNKKTKRQKYK